MDKIFYGELTASTKSFVRRHPLLLACARFARSMYRASRRSRGTNATSSETDQALPEIIIQMRAFGDCGVNEQALMPILDRVRGTESAAFISAILRLAEDSQFVQNYRNYQLQYPSQHSAACKTVLSLLSEALKVPENRRSSLTVYFLYNAFCRLVVLYVERDTGQTKMESVSPFVYAMQ